MLFNIVHLSTSLITASPIITEPVTPLSPSYKQTVEYKQNYQTKDNQTYYNPVGFPPCDGNHPQNTHYDHVVIAGSTPHHPMCPSGGYDYVIVKTPEDGCGDLKPEYTGPENMAEEINMIIGRIDLKVDEAQETNNKINATFQIALYKEFHDLIGEFPYQNYPDNKVVYDKMSADLLKAGWTQHQANTLVFELRILESQLMNQLFIELIEAAHGLLDRVFKGCGPITPREAVEWVSEKHDMVDRIRAEVFALQKEVCFKMMYIAQELNDKIYGFLSSMVEFKVAIQGAVETIVDNNRKFVEQQLSILAAKMVAVCTDMANDARSAYIMSLIKLEDEISILIEEAKDVARPELTPYPIFGAESDKLSSRDYSVDGGKDDEIVDGGKEDDSVDGGKEDDQEKSLMKRDRKGKGEQRRRKIKTVGKEKMAAFIKRARSKITSRKDTKERSAPEKLIEETEILTEILSESDDDVKEPIDSPTTY